MVAPWTAAALTGVLACSRDAAEPQPVRPDVLLVVEDTVRADALGAYGNPRPTSPQLDAVAAAGARFQTAVSPGSWTWPAHASLFTGVGPWEHGARFAQPEPGKTWSLDPMPFVVTMPRADLPTLAERFAAAGYRTASVSANVLVGPGLPQLVRGFQTTAYLPEDAAVVDRVRGILADDDPRPLFLFVNLYGAHGPYELQPVRWLAEHPGLDAAWVEPFLDQGALDLYQPAGSAQRSGVLAIIEGEVEVPAEGFQLIRDAYEGEVAAVDRHLNTLLSAWNASGRGEGIVAVTSDHGEYLGEQGLLEHGRTVYSPVVRVPLVLAAPGRVAAGTVVEAPVQTDQLFHTLLALAEVEGGDPTRSLLAPVEGPVRAAAWSDRFWAEELGGRFALDHKLWWEGDTAVVLSGDAGVEVYDTAGDPLMLRDRAAEHDVEVLAGRVRAAFPAEVRTEAVQVDAETRDQLEALGYVGE